MMADIKLKPCPFCGGASDTMTLASGAYIKLQIFCKKCGVERTKLVGAKDFIHLMSEIDVMAQEWNRRANDA